MEGVIERARATWMITGVAGFIGANLARMVRHFRLARVIGFDNLSYPSVPANLASFRTDPDFTLIEGDLRDPDALEALFRVYRPDAVLNLAAESHVDRSIEAPSAFVETDVLGTQRLLEAACRHVGRLPDERRDAFRFLQASTDEVFGPLAPGEAPVTADSPYRPNSPYAASRASADNLVRAARQSHGLAALICHCSNTYGPRQHPEKLIPLAIRNALAGQPIPLHGDGRQRRDRLFVEDHCRGLLAALQRGDPGGPTQGRYLFGSGEDRENGELLQRLCALLDERRPEGAPHARLITPVADRPGHDRRHAVDPTATRAALHWRPSTGFDEGLARTLDWYLANPRWIESALTTDYRPWIESRHGQRTCGLPAQPRVPMPLKPGAAA